MPIDADLKNGYSGAPVSGDDGPFSGLSDMLGGTMDFFGGIPSMTGGDAGATTFATNYTTVSNNHDGSWMINRIGGGTGKGLGVLFVVGLVALGAIYMWKRKS